MEEKLRAPEGQPGNSEKLWFERCQELQALVQEKEDVITRLEQRLEEQVKRAHTHTVSHTQLHISRFSVCM